MRGASFVRFVCQLKKQHYGQSTEATMSSTGVEQCRMKSTNSRSRSYFP